MLDISRRSWGIIAGFWRLLTKVGKSCPCPLAQLPSDMVYYALVRPARARTTLFDKGSLEREMDVCVRVQVEILESFFLRV